MAYPNYYYPATYQQQFMQPQASTQMSGFIRVPSEDVARNWSVMPGTSVTFINENAPYCYTKTVGFSQLDGSKFERYRLVKEEEAIPDPPQQPVANERTPDGKDTTESKYALRSDLSALEEYVNKLQLAVSNLQLGGIKDEPAGKE